MGPGGGKGGPGQGLGSGTGQRRLTWSWAGGGVPVADRTAEERLVTKEPGPEGSRVGPGVGAKQRDNHQC
ncbi:hypothetical protein BY996DRAFT_6469981, partial [Phakopsora pachyrhizi]